MLADVLASGRFTVTAELGPPVDPDAELVRAAARALAPVVDAANVTDNQAATVKLSPLACSAWMLEEGLEPIMQLTARDRNLMGLQSDLLAGWALGVRTVLGLTGDPLKVGKYEGLATQVGDVDSTGLAKLIVGLNSGTLAAGEELKQPTGYLIAGAANPMLQFMHDKIPGIEVDDATFARIEGLEGDEAKAAGVDIAVDVIKGVRELPGVAGVHIMAPGWEIEAVPRVVEGAGLARV